MNAILIHKTRLHIKRTSQLLVSLLLTGLILFDFRLSLFSRIMSCGLILIGIDYAFRVHRVILLPAFRIAMGLALSWLLAGVGAFGYTLTEHSSNKFQGVSMSDPFNEIAVPYIGYLVNDPQQGQKSTKKEETSGLAYSSYENPRPKKVLSRKQKRKLNSEADKIRAAS